MLYGVDLVVVRENEEDGTIEEVFVKSLELPFVPTVGMRFDYEGSSWIWEMERDSFSPSVVEVVYDLAEERFGAIFRVSSSHGRLGSSFWEGPLDRSRHEWRAYLEEG